MQKPRRLKPGQVSLERALSKLGIASRTQARALILAGQIRVDGFERRDPGYAVVPERARIEMGGDSVKRARRLVLMLYKPRGVVTTRSDEKGRPTVFSLLPLGTPPLHAVGRLDLATTGLLILTNDTRLSAWLTDPANGVIRTYLVSVRGRIEESSLEAIRTGLDEGSEVLRVNAVSLRKVSGKESHLVVSLNEGKNREIRRIFATLGHEVTKLKRVSYGGLELGDLKPGEVREIQGAEVSVAFPGFAAGAEKGKEQA